jgi:hypothetical protein
MISGGALNENLSVPFWPIGCARSEFNFADQNPCSFRSNHVLGLKKSSLSRILGSLGLSLDLLALIPNSSESFESHQSSPEANSCEKPVRYVCRGQQFMPWIAGRLGIGFLFLFGTKLVLDCRRERLCRLGWVLFALSWPILAAPVPWDLGPCNASQNQQTDYRKPFVHDAENVSPISVLWMDRSESITGMSDRSAYNRALFGGAFEKFAWARDLTVGVVLNVATLFLSHLFGLITLSDWNEHKRLLVLAIILPYVAIFVPHILWKIYNSAASLHRDQVNSILQIRLEKESLESRLKEIDSAKPKPSISEETHALSVSILDFIYERSKGTPPPPRKLFGIGTEDTAGMLRRMEIESTTAKRWNDYHAETLGIYEYKFMRAVVSAVKALDAINIRIDTPPGFWSAPQNADAIKSIGTALAELADRIPEEN